ncbi:nucleoporin complex subunit 54-domain-containing protein [Lyophyllum atratum]|nr:nucleoporin complex subunit 54-domain-containing protein [Lyophyllum atratum]
MSFFGNTSTTTPQSGGGLFGQPNNQQQQQQPAGGGLFGNPAQTTTQQAPSVFGSNTQNTQAPSPFGSTSTTNTNVGGGGLFGGQNTNAAQGTTGGLFGGQQQQQQQPSTGGLFGNPQTQSNTGGLFGSTTQQQPSNTTSGGLFGSTTQQQPGATGGGLFGSNTQQPSTTTGGLFGSTTQQPATTGTGLFGSTTTQPQQQQGGGLFGNPSQQSGAGGGLFGSKPLGSGLNINTNTTGTNLNPLFGQPQQQQQQHQQQPGATGGLFSQPSQNQARSSLFGNNFGQSTTSNNTLFGGGNTSTLNTSTLGGGGQTGGLGSSGLTRGSVGPAQQQADALTQHTTLMQRIEEIFNAWNPASPQCRFQHIFYNLVNPNQVSLYQKPPNVPNEVWEKAMRENPDPKCLVPVIATGFDDLRERVDAQSRQAEQHKERLKDIKTRLDALSERHSLSNGPRLRRAASQQTQLTQRLLAFVQHLHLLIPAVRSSSIRPEEEQLRGQLEEIEEEVRRGRIRGKLNELWALIGAINAASERGRGGGGGGQGEWAVVDEEGLAQIAQILSEQQNGLAHLTKILQRHQKDLSVIMGGGVSGDDGRSRYMKSEAD